LPAFASIAAHLTHRLTVATLSVLLFQQLVCRSSLASPGWEAHGKCGSLAQCGAEAFFPTKGGGWGVPPERSRHRLSRILHHFRGRFSEIWSVVDRRGCFRGTCPNFRARVFNFAQLTLSPKQYGCCWASAKKSAANGIGYDRDEAFENDRSADRDALQAPRQYFQGDGQRGWRAGAATAHKDARARHSQALPAGVLRPTTHQATSRIAASGLT
jgi:hypothetical protein